MKLVLSFLLLHFLTMMDATALDKASLNIHFDQDSLWRKLPMPFSSAIRSYVESENNIYYAATTSGVFRSKDYGKTWQSSGLSGQVVDELFITKQGAILAGVYRGGLFSSNDQGESWALLGFAKNAYIYSIVENDKRELFVAAAYTSEGAINTTPTGVFKSIDSGQTWQQTSIKDEDIFHLSIPRLGMLFASSSSNKYYSNDEGVTWTTAGKGLPDSIPVSGIISFNNTLFASVGNRQDESGENRGAIFRSDDSGLTWFHSDSGIDLRSPISSICVFKNTLLASAGFESKNGFTGTYKSVDEGKSWTVLGLNDRIIRFVKVTSDGRIVAGTNGNAFFISRNEGKSWQQTGKGIDNWETFRVIKAKNNLYVSGNGIWRSSNNGKAWKMIRGNGSIDVAITPSGRLLIFESNQILASDNKGNSWYKLKDIEGDYGLFKQLNDTLLIACIANNGAWRSIDNGQTWEKYTLPGYENISMRTAILTSNGYLLLTGSYNDSTLLFRSEDKGATWDKIKGIDNEIWGFAEDNKIIFAGTYASGIFTSSDNGYTWIPSNAGIRKAGEYVTVTSVSIEESGALIASTLGKGIFISKNSGQSWQVYNQGLTTDNIWTVYYDKKNKSIYAASPGGIYHKK